MYTHSASGRTLDMVHLFASRVLVALDNALTPRTSWCSYRAASFSTGRHRSADVISERLREARGIVLVPDQTTLLLPQQDGTPLGLIRLTAGEDTLNEGSEDDRRTGGQPAQITPRVSRWYTDYSGL